MLYNVNGVSSLKREYTSSLFRHVGDALSEKYKDQSSRECHQEVTGDCHFSQNYKWE